MPAAPYTAQFASGNTPLVACQNSAKGPLTGAVKCTGGTCQSFACSGLLRQLFTTIYGPGGSGQINTVVSQYFPTLFGGPNTACQAQSRSDTVSYVLAGGMPVCSVPPAFAPAGWTCAASPVTATASPAPVTPSPTRTVTPGLTRTATPTVSVTSGLTPTASPVYTQAAKSGATAVATPMAGAVALLTIVAVTMAARAV